jgi:methylase of polypeptide subunit release factors
LFQFELAGKSLNLETKNCFRPNLTTQLILNSALRLIAQKGKIFESVLELGCGSGVISTYLAKYGYYDNTLDLALSDISIEAVRLAEINFKENVEDHTCFSLDFKAGKGFDPWNGNKFDLIINDISAVSDEIAKISNWFDCAPCDAGIDGTDNTIKLIETAGDFLKDGGIMIFPVLSLSNLDKLNDFLLSTGHKVTLQENQKWPLPTSMLDMHRARLLELRGNRCIHFEEKFGQFIVETCCYSIEFMEEK